MFLGSSFFLIHVITDTCSLIKTRTKKFYLSVIVIIIISLCSAYLKYHIAKYFLNMNDDTINLIIIIIGSLCAIFFLTMMIEIMQKENLIIGENNYNVNNRNLLSITTIKKLSCYLLILLYFVVSKLLTSYVQYMLLKELTYEKINIIMLIVSPMCVCVTSFITCKRLKLF